MRVDNPTTTDNPTNRQMTHGNLIKARSASGTARPGSVGEARFATKGRSSCSPSSMRHRFRTLHVVLIAALAVVGLGAAIADAAFYKSARPAATLTFRTKPHRITQITFRLRLHCDDGSTVIHAGGIDRAVAINRSTGSFSVRNEPRSSESSSVLKIKGVVRQHRISGHVSERSELPVPLGTKHCETRSGDGDPWLRFVAGRQ